MFGGRSFIGRLSSTRLTKMFPALRFEQMLSPVLGQSQSHTRFTGSHDLPDFCNRHTGDRSRNARTWPGREEQLVVFAAMQRQLQRVDLAGFLCLCGSGNCFGLDACSDAAFLADVREVG